MNTRKKIGIIILSLLSISFSVNTLLSFDESKIEVDFDVNNNCNNNYFDYPADPKSFILKTNFLI
jgi:hypothetical protein